MASRMLWAAGLLISILTSGCIFVPMPGMCAPKTNPYADKIGQPASSAPLRVGASDRAAVQKKLGKPDEDSPAEYFIYSRNNARWMIIWLIPIEGQFLSGAGEYYSLIIYFAPDGKIQKYELHAQDL